MNNIESEEARLLRSIGDLKTEIMSTIIAHGERIAKLEEKTTFSKKIKIGSLELDQSFLITLMLVTALIFLVLDKSHQDQILKFGKGTVRVDQQIKTNEAKIVTEK